MTPEQVKLHSRQYRRKEWRRGGGGGCGPDTQTVTPDSLGRPVFMELGQMKIRGDGHGSTAEV